MIASPQQPSASGTAPAPYNNSNNVATLAVPGLLSTGVVVVAASSDVDGLPGPRFASASADINDLSLGLTIVLTPILSLTATEVDSDASVTGEPLAASGSTAIVNGSVSVLGGAAIPIPVNPAPNTELVNTGGIQIILNEQILSGSLGITVNAIHIILANAASLGLNGDIILSHSQAALVVPEPTTALLVGLGLALLAARGRRSTALR